MGSDHLTEDYLTDKEPQSSLIFVSCSHYRTRTVTEPCPSPQFLQCEDPSQMESRDVGTISGPD